jgi:hypothetical protein
MLVTGERGAARDAAVVGRARTLDGDGAELGGGERRQRPEQRADGRAGDADDADISRFQALVAGLPGIRAGRRHDRPTRSVTETPCCRRRAEEPRSGRGIKGHRGGLMGVCCYLSPPSANSPAAAAVRWWAGSSRDGHGTPLSPTLRCRTRRNGTEETKADHDEIKTTCLSRYFLLFFPLPYAENVIFFTSRRT